MKKLNEILFITERIDELPNWVLSIGSPDFQQLDATKIFEISEEDANLLMGVL